MVNGEASVIGKHAVNGSPCQRTVDGGGCLATPSKGSVGSGSGGGSSVGSVTPSKGTKDVSGGGVDLIQALPEPATLGVSLDEITEEIWAKNTQGGGEGGGR